MRQDTFCADWIFITAAFLLLRKGRDFIKAIVFIPLILIGAVSLWGLGIFTI